MVERIGKESALAREAVRAAQRAIGERVLHAPPHVSEFGGAEPGAVDAGQRADFGRALASGIERVEQDVQSSETLPIELLTGKVDDFHEIAVRVKDAELSFKFAMEIRNKLIDAYREVMRMNV